MSEETEKKNLIGKVIWFYGLSGSGKTTLADALTFELKELMPNIHIQRLDEDLSRQIFTRDLGYTDEDKFENIRRNGHLANLLSLNRITVVASFTTPFRGATEMLKWLMEDRFIPIYINVPLELCIRRDPNGLYVKAMKGEIKNFSGIDGRFEYPFAERKLIQVNTYKRKPSDCIYELLDHLRSKNYEI